MSLAKSLMYYSEIHDIDYTAERIRSLTPEAMQEAAQMILPEDSLHFVARMTLFYGQLTDKCRKPADIIMTTTIST